MSGPVHQAHGALTGSLPRCQSRALSRLVWLLALSVHSATHALSCLRDAHRQCTCEAGNSVQHQKVELHSGPLSYHCITGETTNRQVTPPMHLRQEALPAGPPPVAWAAPVHPEVFLSAQRTIFFLRAPQCGHPFWPTPARCGLVRPESDGSVEQCAAGSWQVASTSRSGTCYFASPPLQRGGTSTVPSTLRPVCVGV